VLDQALLLTQSCSQIIAVIFDTQTLVSPHKLLITHTAYARGMQYISSFNNFQLL